MFVLCPAVEFAALTIIKMFTKPSLRFIVFALLAVVFIVACD